MKKLLIISLLAILGWGGFVYQLIEHHRRREDVASWAEGAYTQGRIDCQSGIKPEVVEHNRAFVVKAVVDGYDGAWN